MQARIVFLDDNEDLRELLPVVLKSALGIDSLCFGNLADLQNHLPDVLRADVAILDINLGSDVPDGLDAFDWLMHQGFQGRVLFLTGHARSNPQLVEAERRGAEVLEKPLHPEQLISSVTRALRRKAA